MKAIIIPPGKDGTHMGDGVYALLAEDGECLATHMCSSYVFAPGDLYTHRPERQPMFEAKGITELVWLAESGYTLAELQERNRSFAETDAESDQSEVSVA